MSDLPGPGLEEYTDKARPNTARSGRNREHRVRDHLTGHGWTPVMRAAASKGPADLLLGCPVRGGLLVQVGTTNKTLGPVDRERFVTAAELTCCLPVLATAGRAGITYWQVTRDTPSKWQEWTP